MMAQINTHGHDLDQAPIHGLPDEILEVIFLINASKMIGKGNENHPYDPHSTTLATAQVCQRWRAVALNYPFIWSRIINYEQHSPLWIETLLARSGSTLIDVGKEFTRDSQAAFKHVLLKPPRSQPVLQSIFQRISGLKKVNLKIYNDPWEPICRSFLGRPAPNLEFLNLVTVYTGSSYPDCLYLDPLFADEAPCLRRLHLRRCLIDFSSSALSNLTELSVRHITLRGTLTPLTHSYRLSLVPSIAGWLRVLKNIPTLRFLTLSCAIYDFTEHESLPVVDLPHLVLLTIDSTLFYQGIPLIDRLNIPPLCGIKFRLSQCFSRSMIGGLDSDSPKLLLFLSKHLSHWPQDCSNRYLNAKIFSYYTGRLRFGNSQNMIGQTSHRDMTESDEVEAHSRFSKDPMLSLVFDFNINHSENSFIFFNQLLEVYSSTFSTTTTLDLGVDTALITASGQSSFSAFPTFHSFTNLKTLMLRQQFPLHLLTFLQDSSALPANHPLFPALESLHLSWPEPNMENSDSVRRAKVVAFLLKRAEAGVPLSEINILAGEVRYQTVEDVSRLGNVRVSYTGTLV